MGPELDGYHIRNLPSNTNLTIPKKLKLYFRDEKILSITLFF